MTVEVCLNSEATKVAADVMQASEKGEWKEDGAKLNYPSNHYSDESWATRGCSDELNEKQTITEPDNGENNCGEEASPGFVQVAEVKPASAGTEVATPADDACAKMKELRPFSLEETILIFDWDDTCLPSAWVQTQGLRLDEESKVSESQRQQLNEVANSVMETFRIAKQHGTVVLVTNAERGWIELSCQKFLPTLYPMLEQVKLLSARTTYESAALASPLDWKLRAFESEIRRVFGEEVVIEPAARKNILSLGDSMHEREALLRATASLPNCRSKSLKFVERPDIGQICKQHSLITGCFDRIVNHDGNLDLCIRCA